MGAYEDVVALATLDIPCQDTGETTALAGGGTLNSGTAATRSVLNGPRADLPRSIRLTANSEWITSNQSLTGVTDYAVELWVYRTGSFGFAPLWASSTVSSQIAAFGDFASRLEWNVGSPEGYVQFPYSAIPRLSSLNQWLHVVGVHQGSVGTFYVNGTLEDSRTIGVANLSGLLNFSVRASSTGGITGFMSGLRFFPQSLNATQIAALYAGPTVAASGRRPSFVLPFSKSFTPFFAR